MDERCWPRWQVANARAGRLLQHHGQMESLPKPGAAAACLHAPNVLSALELDRGTSRSPAPRQRMTSRLQMQRIVRLQWSGVSLARRRPGSALPLCWAESGVRVIVRAFGRDHRGRHRHGHISAARAPVCPQRELSVILSRPDRYRCLSIVEHPAAGHHTSVRRRLQLQRVSCKASSG